MRLFLARICDIPRNAVNTVTPTALAVENRKDAHLSPNHDFLSTLREFETGGVSRKKHTDPLTATADKSSSSWSSDWANGEVLLDLTSRTDNVPSPLNIGDTSNEG